MKKILALALPLLLTVMSVRADVIFQEQFQYTNGPVIVTGTNTVGGVLRTNWIRFSGTASPSDLLVNNNHLEVSSTSPTTPVPNRQDDCGRPFVNTAGSSYTNAQQLIYVSFIAVFTNPPTQGSTYFAMFKTGGYTTQTYQGKLLASLGALPNTVRLGVSVTANTANTIYANDLALNTPYQIVVQWDPVNLDALSLWVNPVTSADPSIVSSDTFTPTTANIINEIAFRQASTFGAFLTVSNLVVATTFNDAALTVLSTNAVAPTIAYQPPAITTNFINYAASLSAVANGQGQGNLTYQWQASSSPANTSPANVSNPNGNTNVLSLDTTTLGNSYYTLIVTTPWGLSTTSSVAKVAIVPAVAPPIFVTQPASKSTFVGDTVTLTTTVTSPGNITYTWFSNNVVVTAGQSDSGLSSSYVVGTVNLSSSATYKVAVTNDTITTGIVSTNAVLTVSSIQAKSIAFIRSLIDPVTLQATNTTTPYQITGIITTLTNITAGNTSSYYLQDGTAGINIFATFGSTFRPAQGDSVTFVGVTSSFSSGLELGADLVNKPYTGGVINSSGNALPTPTVIPFTLTNTFSPVYVATNVAGSLVTLQNVYFGTNAGNTISSTANQNVTVTNASGNPFVLSFFDLDQDTTNRVMPSFASSVTGVLFGNITNYSLAVTKWSDINTSVPVVPIPLTTTYAAGILTFNWSDGSFVLQDSTNVAGPYLTIPGANTGFITNTTSEAALFFRLFHP
jgi:hypothetical protein